MPGGVTIRRLARRALPAAVACRACSPCPELVVMSLRFSAPLEWALVGKGAA